MSGTRPHKEAQNGPSKTPRHADRPKPHRCEDDAPTDLHLTRLAKAVNRMGELYNELEARINAIEIEAPGWSAGIAKLQTEMRDAVAGAASKESLRLIQTHVTDFERRIEAVQVLPGVVDDLSHRLHTLEQSRPSTKLDPFTTDDLVRALAERLARGDAVQPETVTLLRALLPQALANPAQQLASPAEDIAHFHEPEEGEEPPRKKRGRGRPRLSDSTRRPPTSAPEARVAEPEAVHTTTTARDHLRRSAIVKLRYGGQPGSSPSEVRRRSVTQTSARRSHGRNVEPDVDFEALEDLERSIEAAPSSDEDGEHIPEGQRGRISDASDDSHDSHASVHIPGERRSERRPKPTPKRHGMVSWKEIMVRSKV